MGASILTALVILAVDRITKLVIVRNMYCGQSVEILPNILNLTLVHNTGTAFGLMKGCNLFFIALSVLIMAYITAYMWKNKPRGLLMSLSFGLIFGGASGNLLDRSRLGYVVDFIDFRIWPVFNVADSAITIGIALLAWHMLGKHAK